MALKIHKFARKPFYVDAVRVSEPNIEEVANWCEGEIKTDDQGKKYIHIKGVYRPLNDKQTQAYVGDWVLLAATGFKVYIPKAFDKSFEKVKYLSKAQADDAGIKVPHEPSRPPERAKVRQQVVDTPKFGHEEGQDPDEKLPVPTPAAMPPKARGDVNKPFEVTVEDKQQAEADKLIKEVLRHDNSRT